MLSARHRAMLDSIPISCVGFIGFYRQTQHGIFSKWNRLQRFNVEDIDPIGLGIIRLSLSARRKITKGGQKDESTHGKCW